MALKKAIKRPAPKKTTTSPTTSEASVATKPAQRRAVPPPARKPVPPPAKKPILPTEKKSPVMEPPKPAPKKRKPAKASANVDLRQPIQPPKEVKPDEPKAKVQPPVERENRKSPEAPKPAPAAGSDRREAEPRRADTSAEVQRISTEAMHAMDVETRYKLFKKLNKDPEVFVPIRRDLPRQMQMRKNEAVLRELVSSKPPKTKNLTVLYCPYCVDWQVYHYHSWTGYTKCTSCSISSKDFYTAVDNGIFGKE